MFISFEGLDYSGKSTQVRRLAAALEQTGEDVLVLREPGGTTIGEQMRAQLLDRRNSGLTQAGELFLFSASRAQLVQDVIRPALKRNTIVICDRYVDSTTAYQGYGRQIPLDVIASVNRLATGGLLPDRTFFLEIPLEEIERRTHARGVSRDRMESIGREFFSRVQDGFRTLARTEDRILVLDGMNPVEVLHQHVLADVLRVRSVERIQSKQSGE